MKLSLFCISTSLLLTITQAVDWDVVTPLDEYLSRKDPLYQYEVLPGGWETLSYTVHRLNMTTHMWMDESLTTQPVWWHYLTVFIPKQPRFTQAAFLKLSGGNRDSSPPSIGSGTATTLGNFVRATGAVAAQVDQVPNQPIIFQHEPDFERREDQIIAHTWRLFADMPKGDRDPDILLLFPMAKAGKEALDTLEDFVPTINSNITLNNYFVTGGSKRGWAAWLLACGDPRISVLAPYAFDLLNFRPNLQHLYESLGGWSWAMLPYWSENVTQHLLESVVDDLAANIDPLTYKERLTMPKMVFMGASDFWFPIDNAHYFLDQLPGTTFLSYYENKEHGMGDRSDEMETMFAALFLAVHTGYPFPDFEFERSETETGGSLALRGEEPLTVSAWWAETVENTTCEPPRNNTCRRDFRLTHLAGQSGLVWLESPVEFDGDAYTVEFDRAQGDRFKAFYMEMTYPGPEGHVFRFCTEANVIPDVFPYPLCRTPEECWGRIV